MSLRLNVALPDACALSLGSVLGGEGQMCTDAAAAAGGCTHQEPGHPYVSPHRARGLGRALLSLPSAAANIWVCCLPCRHTVLPPSCLQLLLPPSPEKVIKGGVQTAGRCSRCFLACPGRGQAGLQAARELTGVPAPRRPNGTKSTSAKQTPASEVTALHRDRSKQPSDSFPPRL